MFVKHCKVEVYLLELNLCENENMENVVTRHFSKADTIGNVPLLPPVRGPFMSVVTSGCFTI